MNCVYSKPGKICWAKLLQIPYPMKFFMKNFHGALHLKHLNNSIIQSLYNINVTGYWKTDHNVTLGQLHFIGPANSHTHTLPVHCCINGLKLTGLLF